MGRKLLYLFEDYGLDTDRRELYRATSPISVEPKVFDLLAYVIRNRERVVSKEDLIAAIWHGRIVSDSALTTCINAARNAIGDSGEAQRLIKTLPRKGIRFIGIVREEAKSAAVAPPVATPEPSHTSLALPDKPSIAVLPFINLSGDPEQEYFADGIVEDVITALSRVHWLFVIARNSSFIYKGKAVDVKQVGRELGVRYVLEGSVRKASNRVRIAGQLVDATTGAHVWGDHFDSALDDIFDLQDRITASVVGIIEPKLRHVEMERARRKPTESLDAYDLYLRALAQITASYEASLNALRLLRRAMEIDPHYAAPYGLAAWCCVGQRARGWVSPSDPALAEGICMAKLAASLGQDDSETLWMAGQTLALLSGDLEGGIALTDRALKLNPNSANAWRTSGLVHALLGDTELAIAHLERSVRLSPLDTFAWLGSLGFSYAHFMAGRYEEASAWCDKTLHQQPDFPPALRMKAAVCGLLGRLDEGRVWVDRLLAVTPDAKVSGMRLYYGVFMKKPGCLEAYFDGLRKAGLPE